MNFANPLMFWWAALAAPIVIFYILKVRMRRVPVSTLMFWRQVFEEKQARSIWQRLRHWFSLLLQLALLMLLVLALAEPFFNWELREARRLVLVLDNSASMRAADVEPSRLAQAKEKAGELIDSLRQRDEMAIVAAGTQPRVACGFTGHQRTLREALAGVSATDGPTRVNEAAETARRLLADHENGEIVVLSDGCFEGASELAKQDKVVWTSVGTETDNVGITQFQVRRSLSDPLGYQVLAEVTNFSDEPAQVQLNLDLDEQVVDAIPLELEPGGSWSDVFENTSQVGGRLVAHLDHEDALAADNTARAILPERLPQPVILVTEGNLFLQQVFSAQPLVELSVVAEPPETVPEDAVVVYHREVPETLPDGNMLVIHPQNSTDLWQLSEKLTNPIVTEQDTDSPLMAHVRLDNVLMPEAHRLRITSGADSSVLVESASGDPLYFAVELPQGKVLVLTVNLDKGDLPLRTSFPIMVTNALSWFAGHKGELREALSAGAVADVELPQSLRTSQEDASEDVKPLVLESPDGRERVLPAGEEEVTVGPLDRCGVWRLARKTEEEQDQGESAQDGDAGSAERPALEIACNLASSAESDLRVPEELQEKEARMVAGFGGRPLWFYLLAAAGLFAVMEWFLYQRRWIG